MINITERGIILCGDFKIDLINNSVEGTGNFNIDLLKHAILYWDRIDYPKNNFISLPHPKEFEILIQARNSTKDYGSI